MDDAGRVAANPVPEVDPQAGGPKRCIYPGCTRPAVPPHPMGGPQPAFCDREDHNALTAHLERKRLGQPAAGQGAAKHEREEQ
jgi:hypothetical protein